MRKVRFGIIGCGKIADCQHVPRLAGYPRRKAEIVAVYDIKKSKAEAIVKKHKLSARVCDSLEELLAADIDAVVIATPNNFHYPQTVAALNAGKHVLVEKPMTASVKEADDVIRLALRKNLVLQANQSFRYMALYQEAKRQLDKGVIGNLLHAHCIRVGTQMPNECWSPGATWYTREKSNGGVIFDHAVHMADVLQWLCGPIKKTHATTRKLGQSAAIHAISMFDFVNGATGVLELSWGFPVGQMGIELYGTGGVMKFNGWSAIEIIPKNGKKAKVICAEKLKEAKNSHDAFLAAIQDAKMDSWEFGRMAVAACEAIADADRTGAGVAVKYRKETARKTGKES